MDSVTTPLLAAHPSRPLAATQIPSREPQTHDDEDAPALNGDDAKVDARRHLGLFDGVALVLGLQIGSGVFSSPSLVVRNTRSEPAALVVWCIAGGMAWACAACYTELGSRLPFNGGPQEYLSYCFSDLYGFLASWACIFALKPCSAAILALVVADYVCDALSLERRTFDYVPKLVAFSVITLVTIINCMGNKSSNIVTKSLLACKIFGITSVIILGFAVLISSRPSPLAVPTKLKSLPRPGLSNYTDATILAMWAYSGWEALAFVGGELKNPRRNTAIVINTSMTVVIILFVLANIAYFSVLSFAEITHSPTIGLTFSQHFFGRAGGALYTLFICLSCIGTLNIKFFTASRLTQAAADRHFLPPIIRTIERVGSDRGDEPLEVVTNPLRRMLRILQHPTQFGDGLIPLSAILFNALLASAYILVGDFGSLIIFIGIVEYSIAFTTIAGLLTLRLRPKPPGEDSGGDTFRVPWILIFVALAATALIVSVSVIRHPFAGLGFVLLCGVSTLIYVRVIRV